MTDFLAELAMAKETDEIQLINVMASAILLQFFGY